MPAIITESHEAHLPTGQLRIRYGVCTMTIDRWLKNQNLNFPQPIRINRRRYWALSDLVKFEKRQTRFNASAHHTDLAQSAKRIPSIASNNTSFCDGLNDGGAANV